MLGIRVYLYSQLASRQKLLVGHQTPLGWMKAMQVQSPEAACAGRGLHSPGWGSHECRRPPVHAPMRRRSPASSLVNVSILFCLPVGLDSQGFSAFARLCTFQPQAIVVLLRAIADHASSPSLTDSAFTPKVMMREARHVRGKISKRAQRIRLGLTLIFSLENGG